MGDAVHCPSLHGDVCALVTKPAIAHSKRRHIFSMNQRAKAHLCRDRKLAEIIETTTLRRRPKSDGDVYAALLRTIVYQQLSGKAAATIHARFLALFTEQYPSAPQLLKVDDQTLRAAGLSRQKSGYLKNVAQYWLAEGLDHVEWRRLQDQEVVDMLTPIKGVGTWSVQMLLMFTLKRPDILPLGDLGVRNGIVKKYRLRSTGKSLDKRILRIAEPWRPYRTLASLYFWSWVDA